MVVNLVRIILLLVLAALSDAAGAAVVSSFVPGPSLFMTGQFLNMSAPICLPAAGNYNVMYRASVSPGCTVRSAGASDDFATLVFTSGVGSTGGTYTMPQSKVSTFTGSISGTTLTTPANAVVVGSLITDAAGKVVDNTYVTASTNSTTWTVNNSQTVASETMTQSVYPPGEGTCFKNQSTGANQSLLIIAATTSLIEGAAGVVNGNPATQGGQVVLYPGGEACLQAELSNNYLVTGFLPGVWYQSAPQNSPVGSFQWTGLSGYPRLHLSCSGMGSVTTPGSIFMQLAYGGTFQVTGYAYEDLLFRNLTSSTTLTVNTAGGSPSTGFLLTSPLPVNINNGATLDIDLSFANGTGMGFSNDIKGTTRSFNNTLSAEESAIISGTAPLTTSLNVTGIQIFPSAGTIYAMCFLEPKI